jgi:hypothetical protein
MLNVSYAQYHLCWVSVVLNIIYAECQLCSVSLMLSVRYKPFRLNVVMLSVVAPILGPFLPANIILARKWLTLNIQVCFDTEQLTVVKKVLWYWPQEAEVAKLANLKSILFVFLNWSSTKVSLHLRPKQSKRDLKFEFRGQSALNVICQHRPKAEGSSLATPVTTNWGLCYKTLQIHNLQKMAKFRRKLGLFFCQSQIH